jgi:phosphoenolpyruvate carboxylase
MASEPTVPATSWLRINPGGAPSSCLNHPQPRGAVETGLRLTEQGEGA